MQSVLPNVNIINSKTHRKQVEFLDPNCSQLPFWTAHVECHSWVSSRAHSQNRKSRAHQSVGEAPQVSSNHWWDKRFFLDHDHVVTCYICCDLVVWVQKIMVLSHIPISQHCRQGSQIFQTQINEKTNTATCRSCPSPLLGGSISDCKIDVEKGRTVEHVNMTPTTCRFNKAISDFIPTCGVPVRNR